MSSELKRPGIATIIIAFILITVAFTATAAAATDIVEDGSLIIGLDVYELHTAGDQYNMTNVMASAQYAGGFNYYYKFDGRWYDLSREDIKTLSDLQDPEKAMAPAIMKSLTLRKWYKDGTHVLFADLLPQAVSDAEAAIAALPQPADLNHTDSPQVETARDLVNIALALGAVEGDFNPARLAKLADCEELAASMQIIKDAYDAFATTINNQAPIRTPPYMLLVQNEMEELAVSLIFSEASQTMDPEDAMEATGLYTAFFNLIRTPELEGARAANRTVYFKDAQGKPKQGFFFEMELMQLALALVDYPATISEAIGYEETLTMICETPSGQPFTMDITFLSKCAADVTTQYVEIAEQTRLQPDIDKAQSWINTLPPGNTKNNLQTRIDAI